MVGSTFFKFETAKHRLTGDPGGNDRSAKSPRHMMLDYSLRANHLQSRTQEASVRRQETGGAPSLQYRGGATVRAPLWSPDAIQGGMSWLGGAAVAFVHQHK